MAKYEAVVLVVLEDSRQISKLDGYSKIYSDKSRGEMALAWGHKIVHLGNQAENIFGQQ